MSPTTIKAHLLYLWAKSRSRYAKALIRILVAVVAALAFAPPPAAAAPFAAPRQATCRVEEPAGRPVDQADRLIARGVVALRLGTEQQTYNAIDAFVDAVNALHPGDQRFGIAMDGLGCAFLQKAAIQDGHEAPASFIPMPVRASESAGQPGVAPQRPSFELCSTIGADIEHASAAFMRNGRNRELLAQLRGHHQPVPGSCTNPIKVTIESGIYPASSPARSQPLAPPQGDITISNRLDPGETHELAWIELTGRVVLIYLHPGQTSDEVTIPLPGPDTYRYTLELKTFYDADGNEAPNTRGRRHTITLFDGAHIVVYECPSNSKLVWLGYW